jgi:hypothetical protein
MRNRKQNGTIIRIGDRCYVRYWERRNVGGIVERSESPIQSVRLGPAGNVHPQTLRPKPNGTWQPLRAAQFPPTEPSP